MSSLTSIGPINAQILSGDDYLVFVDESFFEFLGFPHLDGNFCHAAVGIPRHGYAAFANALDDVIGQYSDTARSNLGETPSEIKFSTLQRLPEETRFELCAQIANSLRESRAFIAGFFTSSKGHLTERVREDILNTANTLPSDDDDIFETHLERLRKDYTGPRQADLISNLLFLPVMAIATFLGQFNCSFQILYDPRNEQEDTFVAESIQSTVGLVVSKLTPDRRELFRGMTFDIDSRESLGLQVADLVAGSVRNLFRVSPELLTHGTTRNLVTNRTQEPNAVYRVFAGAPVKWLVTELPETLRSTLTEPRSNNLFPHFHSLLAAGILTCVTETGQERDIKIFQRELWDLSD